MTRDAFINFAIIRQMNGVKQSVLSIETVLRRAKYDT